MITMDMGLANRKKFESMCRREGLWPLRTDHGTVAVRPEIFSTVVLAEIPFEEFRDPDWEALELVVQGCIMDSMFL